MGMGVSDVEDEPEGCMTTATPKASQTDVPRPSDVADELNSRTSK